MAIAVPILITVAAILAYALLGRWTSPHRRSV